MKAVFSIDRMEGDLAVCISDDDVRVDVPIQALGGLSVRDVFSAELSCGALVNIEPMPEERDRRIERNQKRLHAYANRKK